MMQVQEEVDWSALQSLCYRRLLVLHQRQRDSRCTLRSLRWAVALLERFSASLDFEPALPQESKSPVCGTPAKDDGPVLPVGDHKRKATLHGDLSATAKKARQRARFVGGNGEAGYQTAERVEAHLALPHIFVVSKFVSHCLLLSLDQQPIATEAGGGTDRDAGSLDLDTDFDVDCGPDGQDGTDTTLVAGGFEKDMWLYKWLVKALLWVPGVEARGQSDMRVAPMDWLVAYLTVTDPSGVIKVVIEDLASELLNCKSRCSPILAVYMRRISILEFTALRMPEHLRTVFSSSLPVSGATRLKFVEEAALNYEELRMRSTDFLASCAPSIWLVFASISSCLLHAFASLWVPGNKSAGDIWLIIFRRFEGTRNFFPPILEVFEDLNCQELEGATSWVCALLKVRLGELAPLAADIVVLLYSTAQSLKLDENLAYISCELLEIVLGQLSHHLLPDCLGSHALKHKSPSSELEGPALFIGNLKQNVHFLWEAILDSSSSCICPSCYGVTSDYFVVLSPSRILCRCQSRKDTSTKLEGGYFDEPSWRKAEATFSEICHLVIMCSEDHVVTDLLVQATAIKFCETGDIEARSLKQLYTVMNVVQVLVAQGSRQHVVKAWATKLRQLLPASNNEQILSMMSALKLLLLPVTWKRHVLASKVIGSRLSLNEDDDCGLAWKSAWQLVRKVLDCEWHTLITLLNRQKAWDMKWSVLNVLQLLPADNKSQSQRVTLRLRVCYTHLAPNMAFIRNSLECIRNNFTSKIKRLLRSVIGLPSAIRVFFSFLQERDKSNYSPGDSNQWRNVFGAQWWHFVRIIEQLKEIIVDHAAVRFSCFVLMVDNLLDFSFVLSGLEKKVSTISPQQSSVTSKMNHCHEYLCIFFYQAGLMVAGERLKLSSLNGDPLPEMTPSWFGQCSEYTSTGKVSERGIFAAGSARRATVSGSGNAFPDFDRVEAQRSVQHSHMTRQGPCRMTTMVAYELESLLRRTLEKGRDQARELHPCDRWPSQPAAILATMIMSRLETPHEMPMTMEQYEEVLPRHVCSPRHTYLMECFNNNPLLFEILQMVFEHGGSPEVIQCAELLRALLADCITQFHSTFRPRQHFSAAVEGADLEVLARMQVSKVIQVVWLSGWLPESLACSKEIVHAIDRAYIPDLLLLVWRCMHDNLAVGAKALDGPPGGLRTAQDTVVAAGEAEVWQDNIRDSWEAAFQSILRQNIVQVCAHIAHIYPG